MKKNYKPGRRIKRFLPCPAYDFRAIEGWLEDMAREGLIPIRDGLSSWRGTFEYQEPQNVQYRLEAVQDLSRFEPDPEQVELGEKYGWEYVAALRNYYIYRSADPAAREMNTDPEVLALALNAVKKRMLLFLIWVIYYGSWSLYNGIRGFDVLKLQKNMSMGTIHHMILVFLLLLWYFLCIKDCIVSFTFMKKIQKTLRNEGSLPEKEGWRKRTGGYRRGRILMLVTAILLFVWLFVPIFTKPDNIPLDSYQKPLPFATLQDLLGEEYRESIPLTLPKYLDPNDPDQWRPEYEIRRTVGGAPNTLWEKEDLLASRIMEYSECAEYLKDDGTSLKAGMKIHYYHMRSAELAKKLVSEFYQDRYGMGEPVCEINEDTLYVDYYWNLDGYGIIVRKEDIVVQAYIYQSPMENGLSMEAWAERLCDSLGE